MSRKPGARAKWNFPGSEARLWLPRGPEFGQVELWLDGVRVAILDLHADAAMPSSMIWQSPSLPDDYHALVLTSESGRLPLDSLDVAGKAGRSK